MGVSDFRRFGAMERAVWPLGRAGTAAPSGCMSGPEITLASHLSDCPGVPTYEAESQQHKVEQRGKLQETRALARK
eukprot:10348973-Alexandrium_andersonii.AAC.1